MQSIIALDPYTRGNKLHKIIVTDSRQNHSHMTITQFMVSPDITNIETPQLFFSHKKSLYYNIKENYNF